MNLHRLVQNNHFSSDDSKEAHSVDEGMNCVTSHAHNIIYQEIHDCKVEKIKLIIACLFEDFAPMNPLLQGGISDVVMDKTYRRVYL